MKMASLKDISERYKGICESFIKKTVKTGLKDKGDSVFKLPENYIEIALMKIIESRGIEDVDIDYSEILEENPDKSKWVPTLVYIDTDDTLGVRWDKFLAYNTECGCIDVYEDTDSYESFSGQDEYVQKELYREVIDALGMEYVEPETMYYQTLESFVGHVSRKRNTDLIPDAIYPDGVYILHETLGVRTVDGWNPNDNEGVVGVLVVEDEHKIVVALEDAPEKLCWTKKWGKVNQPVDEFEDAKSDFNGEMYCRKLDSPDFPAAYYCLNYKKGGRKWYLPSIGELWMIYNHLEEIQTALETVGGQKFFTDYFDENIPCYWSSTEAHKLHAWDLDIDFAEDYNRPAWDSKVEGKNNVRPVSNFSQNKNLKESFTKKIKSTRKSDLVSDIDYPDGVYILHETFGVRTVDSWNPKDNDEVIGVLVVEDEHQIVIALEDSPENLRWTKRRKLVNRPIEDDKDAEFDFNGEDYCKSLNSPDFPAAYYCKTYNKGNRSWYLPSSGELRLIYRHLDEIQNALETVGGQKLITTWDEGVPVYWSSTEGSAALAWDLYLTNGGIHWDFKVSDIGKVRPVSNFRKKNTLKESFTKKISSKKNTDLVPDLNYPDGVYILHEILGVKFVEGWNPEDNEGVVGVLVIEDDHKIVVALEDSPKNLLWLKEHNRLINEPVEEIKDAESDFNGEEHCVKLNSPDFPAAYYCKTYNKGGRSWYLPSSGELWLICRHLEEIQNALETVGGQKFLITAVENDVPWYWSSTESFYGAWGLYLSNSDLGICNFKVILNGKVRPVSNFNKNKNLKESFTRKTSKTKAEDLRTRADESVLPKNYIELALMSVLCSAKKEGICFRKPKFRYKEDFGDVYELSEVFLQNDGQEIGGYAQRHYLEIEWNVYENGYMEEEPVSEVYPFKDEDNEIKAEIYKRVLQYLGMEYVSPNIRWMEFDDEGFDYFDN